ncbi:MAG: aldehyde dehydrogenase [Mycobacterium sp.]|jgi:aldehyde dehydrogenase (NAD+)|nr:aldehyde dehydrogenase [Mycobacterium sp.]
MSETSTVSSGGHAETGSAPSQAPAGRRMLIDGILVETQRTFPSINPATDADLRIHCLEQFHQALVDQRSRRYPR